MLIILKVDLRDNIAFTCVNWLSMVQCIAKIENFGHIFTLRRGGFTSQPTNGNRFSNQLPRTRHPRYTNSMYPLHNTRILDLTRLLPGAVCTMLLGDLGAEIIKIEDPIAGDYARQMPPLIDGMGAFFRSSNRGKKSIVLDLKQPAGQAVLHRLVKHTDVLIEVFRPGVTARLGADYETLRAINPRLVYCSLSGWGQTGPMARVSGHDLNYIARNGLLGGELNPQTLGAKVADVGGAYVGVMGILAALLQRERSAEGHYVDVALSEAAMPFAMLSWVHACCQGSGGEALNLGGANACYRVYYCADDEPVVLSAVELKFWANFCVAVDKPEWIALHTVTDRQPALIEEVAALFRSRSAAEWTDLLDKPIAVSRASSRPKRCSTIRN